MTQSTAVATTGVQAPAKAKDRITSIRDMIMARAPAMAQVLPKHLSAERLARIATFDIARNPSLAECSPESLVGCVLQSAQLGLEPGVIGHAYLVPYRNKGVPTCTLIVGYKGLVELARRSGQLSTIQARAVYRGDAFAYDLGLEPKLTHQRAESPELDEQGRPVITHVYAVAKLRDGGTQWEVMTRREVDGIRGRSRAGQSGPWVTDYEEMAKKTVLRRLCKLLPMSIEAAEVVAREDEGDHAGVPADLAALAVPDAQPIDGGEGVAIDHQNHGESTQATTAKAAARKAAGKTNGSAAAANPPAGPPIYATATLDQLADLSARAGYTASETEMVAMEFGYAGQLPDAPARIMGQVATFLANPEKAAPFLARLHSLQGEQQP